MPVENGVIERSQPQGNSFRDSLKNIKVYDLPVAVEAEGGVQVINSPAAAFEYAGNWYLAPKTGNKLSANPKDWSLIVGDGSPNRRFYHMDAMQASMPEAQQEFLHTVGNGLSAKARIGSLPPSGVTLAPEALENIILSKEHPGSGLRVPLSGGQSQLLGTEEPIHAVLRENSKAFEFTPEEVRRANQHLFSGANDAKEAQVLNERVLLHQATDTPFMATPKGGVLGGAFQAPRERVFYVTHPDNPDVVHRLKVGFDEELAVDGSRAYRPAIHEKTISLADAMKEIGPDNEIGHAPEGIGAFMKGDPEGLSRYAKLHIGGDFAGRQQAHNVFTHLDGKFHQSTTHHLMGEELTGKEMSTQAWHRIVRPEDYVAQVAGEGAVAGSTDVAKAASRIFDSNRADYFMIRQHPEYTKYLKGEVKDYSGPMEQLLFLKGDPQGIKPAALEAVDLPANRAEAILELRKRGIGQDTRLLKIGKDEYAELWAQRNLKDHINYFQLERETAKETIATQPLKYHSFGTDHKLAEPIRVEGGKLVGDVDGLCSKGLYKLGEDHFVHITPDLTSKEKFHYEMYKKTPAGIEKAGGREFCMYDGEFEYKLTDLIKHKGALTNASEEEMLGVAQHLVAASKVPGNEGAIASHNLDLLLSSEKPKLPEGMGTRLQQATDGTLEGLYARINKRVKKPAAPAAEAVNEPHTGATQSEAKPRVAPEGASTAANAERTTAREAASGARAAEGAEGTFIRFMKNEKWAGKKGLVVAGATIAIGAIIYGAHKVFGKKPEPEENQPWTERIRNTTSQDRQASL